MFDGLKKSTLAVIAVCALLTNGVTYFAVMQDMKEASQKQEEEIKGLLKDYSDLLKERDGLSEKLDKATKRTAELKRLCGGK